MQGAGEITPPGKSAGLPETVQLPLEEDFSTPLGPFKRLATEEEVRQWQHSNSSFIEGPTPYKTLQEIPVVEFDGAPPIDQILEKGSRVLWIKKDNSSLLIGPKDAKQLKSEWQSDLADWPQEQPNLLQRFLTSRHHLRFGSQQLQLARSEPDAEGNVRLYLHYKNKILDNPCNPLEQAGLHRWRNDLQDNEKMLLNAAGLPTDSSCTGDQNWYFVARDEKVLELVAEGLRSKEGLTPERAEELADSLEELYGITKEDFANVTLAVIGGGAGIAIIVSSVFAIKSYFLQKISVKLQEEGIRLQKESIALQRETLERLEGKDLVKLETFVREMNGRLNGPSTFVSGLREEAVLERMADVTNKKLRPHIVVWGDNREGKDAHADEFMRRAKHGQYPHLDGYKLIEVDTTTMEAAQAKYHGLTAKVAEQIRELAYSGKHLIKIPEGQVAAETGLAAGHETSLLAHLRTVLEDPKCPSKFIITTDNPAAIKAVRGMGGRFSYERVPVSTFESALRILEGRQQGIIAGRDITVQPEVLRAVVHTAQFRAESRNGQALEIFDELVSQADRRRVTEITKGAVIELAAHELSIEPANVAKTLTVLEEFPDLEKRVARQVVAAIHSGEEPASVIKKLRNSGKPKTKGGGRRGGGGGGGTGGGARSGRASITNQFDPFARRLGHAGGFLFKTAPFAGLEILEHKKFISMETKHHLLGGALLLTIAANPLSAVALVGMAPGFIWGQSLLSKRLHATGIKGWEEGSLTNKITSLVGGMAAGELSFKGALMAGARLAAGWGTLATANPLVAGGVAALMIGVGVATAMHYASRSEELA